MKRKTVSGIMLTLLLIEVLELSSVFLTKFSVPVRANPIPYPTLWMPEEYINATISWAGGLFQAKVYGAYPFGNVGFESVTMYYPIPPDASAISVNMDEAVLDWDYSNRSYPTVIGDFPMVYWTISPLPSTFLIKTYYEHSIPLRDGNYTFLYAMGTGRYLPMPKKPQPM